MEKNKIVIQNVIFKTNFRKGEKLNFLTEAQFRGSSGPGFTYTQS